MLQGILILAATSAIAAPALPPKAKVQKTVTVVVDYVNVGSADFETAWKRSVKGPNHDADLLAALREGGATDLQGARVTAKADRAVRSETKMMAHGTMIVDSKAQSVYLQTVFKTRITPHVQGDGVISVRLELEKIDTALSPTPGKPHQDLILMTTTFHNGKTVLIDSTTSSKWHSGAGEKTRLHAPWKQLVFVTATVDAS